MVAHTCNPSTQEAEAVELWVSNWPELHGETLSHQIKSIKHSVSQTVIEGALDSEVFCEGKARDM
jgi:hypothetical protein